MRALQAASLDISLEADKAVVDALPGSGQEVEVAKGCGLKDDPRIRPLRILQQTYLAVNPMDRIRYATTH